MKTRAIWSSQLHTARWSPLRFFKHGSRPTFLENRRLVDLGYCAGILVFLVHFVCIIAPCPSCPSTVRKVSLQRSWGSPNVAFAQWSSGTESDPAVQLTGDGVEEASEGVGAQSGRGAGWTLRIGDVEVDDGPLDSGRECRDAAMWVAAAKRVLASDGQALDAAARHGNSSLCLEISTQPLSGRAHASFPSCLLFLFVHYIFLP